MLFDGAAQLKDGSITLLDGMKTLKDGSDAKQQQQRAQRRRGAAVCRCAGYREHAAGRRGAGCAEHRSADADRQQLRSRAG